MGSQYNDFFFIFSWAKKSKVQVFLKLAASTLKSYRNMNFGFKIDITPKTFGCVQGRVAV